jgi:hypothetical protein
MVAEDMDSTPILLGLQTCRATDRQPPAPRMRCSNDVLQGLTGASDLACLGLLDSQTSVPPHLRGLATMAQICLMLRYGVPTISANLLSMLRRLVAIKHGLKGQEQVAALLCAKCMPT